MRVSDRGANGDHLKQADSELLGVADAAVYLNTSERLDLTWTVCGRNSYLARPTARGFRWFTQLTCVFPGGRGGT